MVDFMFAPQSIPDAYEIGVCHGVDFIEAQPRNGSKFG
jgi:hypothetical protein